MENRNGKCVRNVDSKILDKLWIAAEVNPKMRLAAVEDILKVIQAKQNLDDDEFVSPDLTYCVERLIKGLNSSRKAARQGFAVLLTEILLSYTCVKTDIIINLMTEHLPLKNKTQLHDSNIIIGRAMGYGCIIRSRRLTVEPEYILEIVQVLNQLSSQTPYIQQFVCCLLEELFSQMDANLFKKYIWRSLKKELAVGWESCTPNGLWLLIVCRKTFPEIVKRKFLLKYWGHVDIIIPNSYLSIGTTMKKSRFVHPFIHPCCMEVLGEVIKTKQLKEFWQDVVEGILLEPKNLETAFLVFELSKKALSSLKSEKDVQIILSHKFCNVFIRAALTKHHPLYSAANQLCRFLVEFSRNCEDASVQALILKCFISPPGTILFDVQTKTNFVTQLLSKLKSSALHEYAQILKDIFVNENESLSVDNEEDYDRKCNYVAKQMGLLAGFEGVSDEVKVELLQFLLLHGFFDLHHLSSDVPLCSNKPPAISPLFRSTCQQSFLKGLELFQRPHTSGIGARGRIKTQLKVMLPLVEFGNLLFNSTSVVKPLIDVESVKPTWDQMMKMLHKLNKWSQKYGKADESNIFQILFSFLGLQLFTDCENVSSKIEELQECCKRVVKQSKCSEDEKGEEPFWADVVVDIMLSILSDGSAMTRIIVQSVFSLMTAFITRQSIQQILDVLNSGEDGGPLVMPDDESEGDVEFHSGTSSEEESERSDKEESEIEEEFKTSIQKALGSAADISGVESETYMSDSEMMKVDDAIGKALGQMIKQRKKSKTMGEEDKSLLHFRLRCMDLISRYIKSGPPLSHILQMILPLVDTVEHSLQNQHQNILANKALDTLKLMVQMKKFSSMHDVLKETFVELTNDLVLRFKKASEPRLIDTLGKLCIYVVTCSKKWFKHLDLQEASNKKEGEEDWYLSIFAQFLKDSFQKRVQNLQTKYFQQLMTLYPVLSLQCLPTIKSTCFGPEEHIHKKAQALSLLTIAIRNIMAQETASELSEITSEILSQAVAAVQEIDLKDLKPLYTSNLLNVLLCIAQISKKKYNQDPLLGCGDLVKTLNKLPRKRLNNDTKKNIRKLITLAAGTVQQKKGSGKRQKKQGSRNKKNLKTEL